MKNIKFVRRINRILLISLLFFSFFSLSPLQPLAGKESHVSVKTVFKLEKVRKDLAPHIKTGDMVIEAVGKRELGIFALVAFFFVLLFTCRNCFSVEFSANETSARPICAASFCGILALLVNGLFDYVWDNYRVCLLFWLLLGICNATYRIGTAEQRQIDYRASLISNIASTDIQIRK